MNSYENVDDHSKFPMQLRSGPISEHTCTDFLCCIFYVLLLASVIFLGVVSSQASHMSEAEINNILKTVPQGKPLLAISQSIPAIVLSLLCVVALCFILVITTFLIPSLVAYLYIPLFLILMALVGAGFLYRYFGNQLPFVNQDFQSQNMQSGSLLALGVGILFIFGFIASLIVIISKKQKFKNIVFVLQLAKTCFWENSYMFLISIVLSAISIGALYFNLLILMWSQDESHSQHYVDRKILGALIIIEAIWTHGYMQALSDFIFEGIAIHWYFNEKKLGASYGRIANNLIPTIGLSFKHIGTIAFGHILAYIPQSFLILIKRFQDCSQSCYSVCCLCHRCACEHLSKYCYTMTILQSEAFCPASVDSHVLRQKSKSTTPYLYMMGNFYITLAKIFIVLVGITVAYFLLMQYKAELFANMLNLIAPLLVTLIASVEIANHFMDSTGLVGDTITLMYALDKSVEMEHFVSPNPYSCPQAAHRIIKSSQISYHGDQ